MTATVGTNSPMTPVPGPVPGTVMTPGYARAVAQMAYAWGWPMVNIQSRRLMYAQVPIKGRLGPMPVAPLNELAMLADYIDPNIRIVAHPNQDVVYGFGVLALDQEPVVVQIPDFGDRFWMYQICDQRTDSFAQGFHNLRHQAGLLSDGRPGAGKVTRHRASSTFGVHRPIPASLSHGPSWLTRPQTARRFNRF